MAVSSKDYQKWKSPSSEKSHGYRHCGQTTVTCRMDRPPLLADFFLVKDQNIFKSIFLKSLK